MPGIFLAEYVQCAAWNDMDSFLSPSEMDGLILVNLLGGGNSSRHGGWDWREGSMINCLIILPEINFTRFM